MRVQVVRVPAMPHGGRAYIDGDVAEDGGGPLIVWVREDLVTDEEADTLEAELNCAAQQVLGSVRESA